EQSPRLSKPGAFLCPGLVAPIHPADRWGNICRYAKYETSRLGCCLNCFTLVDAVAGRSRYPLRPGIRVFCFKLGGRLHAKGISLVTDLVGAVQFPGRRRIRWCPGTGRTRGEPLV